MPIFIKIGNRWITSNANMAELKERDFNNYRLKTKLVI